MPARPMFGIFEGGGAKGVAHIGAAMACEQNDFFFVGVAGASAGALAAVLLAVGFKADELLDPARPDDNILTRNGLSPVDLLGRKAWNRVNRNRHRLERLMDAEGFFGKLLTAPDALPLLNLVRARWSSKGLMSTDPIRAFLNGQLRGKLQQVRDGLKLQGPLPKAVTFGDLDPGLLDGRVLPLKIMGANVSTRELWVFDRELTPDVEVAQAVAASIAIPGVFHPVEITVRGQTHRFVDGGVVSNLPIWVFAGEKLSYERANPQSGAVPIVGFTLRDKPSAATAAKKTRKDGLLRYLGSVIQTGLAGSQTVSQRFVQDLTVVPLSTNLKTLDFDASQDAILNAYNDGRRCADQELKHALIERPRLVKDELSRIRKAARAGILKVVPPGKRRGRWTLRANVVERPGHGTYRVTFGDGMDADADDRLLLDERGRGAPAAFIDRTALLMNVGPKSHPHLDYMTKYERALVPSTVRSIICVPIFPDVDSWYLPDEDRPEPCGVLSIDSSLGLETAFNDPDFIVSLIVQSTLLHPVLTQEPKRG